MANIKSAIKRARQNTKLRAHNMTVRTRLRTYIKNVVKAIETGKKEDAQAAYQLAQPVIDKAAGKGFIHKNKAARHKSRLNAAIKKLNPA